MMETMVLKVSIWLVREVRLSSTSEGCGKKVFAHRFMKSGSVLAVRMRPRIRKVVGLGRGGLRGVADFS